MTELLAVAPLLIWWPIGIAAAIAAHLPTPQGRTFVIPASTRTATVPAHPRRASVPAQTRRTSVPVRGGDHSPAEHP